MEQLITKIFAEIKRHPQELRAYDDLFALCRNMAEEDPDEAHRVNGELREQIVKIIPKVENVGEFFALYRKTLLFDAPVHFDSYLLYLEIDRLPEERFYQPRRKRLKEVADALQRLVDGELDELFLTEPPRIGKTTMLMLFVTWIIGRFPESSNLYSAFSDIITKAFYNGVLEIINDPITYRWHDVFPEAKIASQNAQEETLNIDRKKRYPSLTCRSLYGTLNGACDCNGFLISDDLIGGIEEALNKDRLVAAWSKVDNNLLTRAKQKAKILWCGTRWSIFDPAGVRMELLANDPVFAGRRYQIINLPALDENDESNFDYDYGVGYDTQYYRERRASFERNGDMASWMAQFQGMPIEREGALFTPDEFRYYNGTLPEGDPDRVFIAVDPAFGGGDYVAAPVCYQYGEDIYVHDVVYDDHDKKITQPLLVNAVARHSAQAMQIEANKSTEGYKDGVGELLRKKGLHINLTSKAAPSDKAKSERIFDKAPDIREMMIFRESGTRSKPYELFIQNVFSYKMFGKNKHDDAPDSLAMAINMALRGNTRPRVFKRPF